MYGPVIKGKLVTLRPPRPDEAPAIATWFEDLEVNRFILRRHPPSVEMEKEFLERVARDADEIWWAVEHEGRLVGGTGIHAIDWKNGFGTTGTVIGDKSAWGKGLARELMRLRADYVFTQLPLRKLKSGYLEGNEAPPALRRRRGTRKSGGGRRTTSWTASGSTT